MLLYQFETIVVNTQSCIEVGRVYYVLKDVNMEEIICR